MNIRRASIDDADFMRTVYGSEGMWAAISDDNTPALDEMDLSIIIKNPAVFVLIPDNIGTFVFHPHNSVMYEMHSAVLPECRGRQSLEGARLAGMWMFENTPCQKIITLVPQGNVRADVLARKGGMTREGTLTKSFLRGGRLIDQHIYGITKEDAICHCSPQRHQHLEER